MKNNIFFLSCIPFRLLIFRRSGFPVIKKIREKYSSKTFPKKTQCSCSNRRRMHPACSSTGTHQRAGGDFSFKPDVFAGLCLNAFQVEFLSETFIVVTKYSDKSLVFLYSLSAPYAFIHNGPPCIRVRKKA